MGSGDSAGFTERRLQTSMSHRGLCPDPNHGCVSHCLLEKKKLCKTTIKYKNESQPKECIHLTSQYGKGEMLNRSLMADSSQIRGQIRASDRGHGWCCGCRTMRRDTVNQTITKQFYLNHMATATKVVSCSAGRLTEKGLGSEVVPVSSMPRLLLKMSPQST